MFCRVSARHDPETFACGVPRAGSKEHLDPAAGLAVFQRGRTHQVRDGVGHERENVARRGRVGERKAAAGRVAAGGEGQVGEGGGLGAGGVVALREVGEFAKRADLSKRVVR